MTDTPSYFEFSDVSPKHVFVIQLIDPKKIAHARRILNGEETYQIHIQGTIVKEPASYNPDWSYHLDPDTISFFGNTVEVCDSTMEYIENNLKDVGGAFLPQNFWCPWSSKLLREKYDK